MISAVIRSVESVIASGYFLLGMAEREHFRYSSAALVLLLVGWIGFSGWYDISVGAATLPGAFIPPAVEVLMWGGGLAYLLHRTVGLSQYLVALFVLASIGCATWLVALVLQWLGVAPVLTMMALLAYFVLGFARLYRAETGHEPLYSAILIYLFFDSIVSTLVRGML